MISKILRNKYSPWLTILVVAILFILMKSDGVYNLLTNASFDDTLQFNLAQSISNGQWLGPYDSLTLAKGPTYPLWLATMHVLSIPLWLGQALLYALACFALIYAIRSLFRNKWLLPIIFSILVFNPMLSDRVYREAISPSLLLMLLAWTIGILIVMFNDLFKKRALKRDFFTYTFIGALALPGWWYLREDAFWVLPYISIFLITTLISVWVFPAKKLLANTVFKSRLIQSALLITPIIVTFSVGVVIATINLRTYGRYVVNDYTSEEFKSAYGALTRVHDEAWQPTVPVSSSMRQQIYKVSPLFAKLKPCLDNQARNGNCDGLKGVRYKSSTYDYEGGWFFWALRVAVQENGYYTSPTTAASYYTALATQINNACDAGKLRCDYGERSSLAPPFRSEVVPETAKNLVSASWFFFTLKDSDAFLKRGDTTYDPVKQQMADYYEVQYLQASQDSVTKLKLEAQEVDVKVYGVISVGLFAAASLALLFSSARIVIYRANARKMRTEILTVILCWLLVASLIMARLVMIAYVSATSFPTISTFYLSSLYVAALVFECLILGLVIDRLAMRFRTSKLSGRSGSSKSKKHD